MRLSLALSILFIPLSLPAAEALRPSAGYVEVGLRRSIVQLSESSSSYRYDGWGWDGEAGVDLRLVEKMSFGFQTALTGSQSDLRNLGSGSAFVETGRLQSTGAKVGIYWDFVTLGGGTQMLKFSADTLNSSGVQSSTTGTGSASYLFVSCVFATGRPLRASLEARMSSGKIGSLDYTESSLSVRLGFSGIFGND